MRDEDGGASVVVEEVQQFQLQLPLEVAVECGERLVEQQQLCIGGEDARERRALLLPARELLGVGVFESRKRKARKLPFEELALFFFRAACRKRDVLGHGHVGKEGVVLEQVADAALLRREVHALFAVEERAPVEQDASLVGLFDARDALQGHALAAARGAEQREHFVAHGKFHGEIEAAQFLANLDFKFHYFPAALKPYFSRIAMPFSEETKSRKDFASSMCFVSFKMAAG